MIEDYASALFSCSEREHILTMPFKLEHFILAKLKISLFYAKQKKGDIDT